MKKSLLALLALTLALAACNSTNSSRTSPAALNGTYSGVLSDDRVGPLGAHAMEVTTHGTTFSGAYCFMALTGGTVCNTVEGTVRGTRESGSVAFRVGDVSFDGTVSRNTAIRGRHRYADGSGAFDMDLDPSPAGLSALHVPAQSDGIATGASAAFADALRTR